MSGSSVARREGHRERRESVRDGAQGRERCEDMGFGGGVSRERGRDRIDICEGLRLQTQTSKLTKDNR